MRPLTQPHLASVPEASALYKSAAGYRAMMDWYRSALGRWPAPHQAQTVPTRYGDTHVLVCGPVGAPPVVLLHALSANAAMWGPQAAALAAGYQVYAPDIIGMTGRSAPTRLPYGGPGYAVWLRDVLDGLGLERATMIGLGFGGWLVSKYAAIAPGRVRRAVLLSPAGIVPVRWRYLIPIIWDVLFINDEQARRLSHVLLAPPHVPVDAATAEALYLIIKHFKTQFEAPALPDHELRHLTMPTMLMIGEHEDVWDLGELIARARRLLPDLRAAEVIPGAGHGLTATHSAAVMARVLQFLADDV